VPISSLPVMARSASTNRTWVAKAASSCRAGALSLPLPRTVSPSSANGPKGGSQVCHQAVRACSRATT